MVGCNPDFFHGVHVVFHVFFIVFPHGFGTQIQQIQTPQALQKQTKRSARMP